MLFYHIYWLNYFLALRRISLFHCAACHTWLLNEYIYICIYISAAWPRKGFSAVSWTQYCSPVGRLLPTVLVVTAGSWRSRHHQSEIRHHSSQRSINRWNSLSQEAVDAPSINSFKNHLEKLRKRQIDFFVLMSSKSYGCNRCTTSQKNYHLHHLHQQVTRCSRTRYVPGIVALRSCFLWIPEPSHRLAPAPHPITSFSRLIHHTWSH